MGCDFTFASIFQWKVLRILRCSWSLGKILLWIRHMPEEGYPCNVCFILSVHRFVWAERRYYPILCLCNGMSHHVMHTAYTARGTWTTTMEKWLTYSGHDSHSCTKVFDSWNLKLFQTVFHHNIFVVRWFVRSWSPTANQPSEPESHGAALDPNVTQRKICHIFLIFIYIIENIMPSYVVSLSRCVTINFRFASHFDMR